MSWLETLTTEMLANLPPRPFAPNVAFGFEHVRRSIEIVEAAIEAHKEDTQEAGRAAVQEAMRDPSRSFVKEPLFAPMGRAAWYAEMTFPLILRRSLFIATCSHVEHVLRRWCHMLRNE